MKPWHRVIVISLIILNVFLFFKILLSQGNIQLFNPQGMIAIAQKNLLITYVCLMFVIVIPVFIATAVIAWKYRSSNPKADFNPHEKQSTKAELLLWLFPTVIVLIMSWVTWDATHKLNPHDPIASDVKPLTIQVVALQWKWLFIYPEQNIATVNYLAFPEKTPLNFVLTADGPMSSFWIPQLGGQLYAMTGMSQSLHLIADHQGEFQGSNAEISGHGFATMRFPAKSVSNHEFEQWVKSVRQSPHTLTHDEYDKLAEPSENVPQLFYNSTESDLFTTIMMKFMMPPSPTGEFHIMENGERMEGATHEH